LPHINRGVAYFYKGEYDKAWEDFNMAQRLGYPVPPEFLNHLRLLRKASGGQE
jgi:hypothetical protein